MLYINRIKGYRASLGYTQKQFSEMIGCSEKTYNLKENGKREFYAKEILAIFEIIKQKYPEVRLEEIFLGQK